MDDAPWPDAFGSVAEKKSRDHVIVSSGWWSCQAGRAEGGGSGTRDELGALHSALREQAPSTGPIQLVHSPLIVSWRIGEHLFAEMEGAPIDSGGDGWSQWRLVHLLANIYCIC